MAIGSGVNLSAQNVASVFNSGSVNSTTEPAFRTDKEKREQQQETALAIDRTAKVESGPEAQKQREQAQQAFKVEREGIDEKGRKAVSAYNAVGQQQKREEIQQLLGVDLYV